MTDIVYIGNFILPDKNPAAQRVLSNAKLINSIGYRVILVGASDQGETSSVSQYLSFPTFPCQSGYYQTISSLWSVKHFYRVLDEFSNTAAVILYNYRSVSMARIRRICRKRGIVCIADTTEWYEPHGDLVSKLITAFDSFFRMRLVQPHMDGLIPTSRYLYDYYKKYGKPMVVLPTLVDKNEYMPYDKEKQNKVRTLVFAGSAGPNKDRLDIVFDLLEMVRAKKQNLEFVLKIIGSTEAQFNEQFPDYRVSAELHESIVFYGRLTRTETLKQVSIADYTIFLRPNNRVCNAGFPTKLSESLACGTPVITNRVGDAELYIVDGVTGWFIKTNNYTEATEKIAIALEQSDTTLNDMAHKCRETDTLSYNNYQERMQGFMKEMGL